MKPSFTPQAGSPKTIARYLAYWRYFINRHFFKMIVAGALVYALYQKDLQIGLQMVDPAVRGPEWVSQQSIVQAHDGPHSTERKHTAASDDPVIKRKSAYVQQHLDLALAEMHQHGIPASVTLAQALLESQAGTSRLARENRNHFGIKCFSKTCRKGHCRNFADDHHKDFFRIYPNVKDSYRARSRLLQSKRYRHLFDLKTDDYRGWAYGLQEAGYATDSRYADKLIELIEQLELWEYDY